MRVRDWMTPSPQAVGRQDLLQHAREVMDRGCFRHLPVVDESGRLVGIVTDRDLREHHGHLEQTRVTAAAVEAPVTVSPDDTIETAMDVVLRRKIGCLPVLDSGGKLVGIITETDLLRGRRGERARAPDSAAWVDVQLTAPTHSLSDALDALERNGCPVLGARQADDPSAARLFRLRVDDAAHCAATLREHGFAVRNVCGAR